jgi:uncharacterized protein (DUF427 family)
MTIRVAKVPDEQHPISISPFVGRVTVKAGGRIVADTRRALVLQEANYPAVHYVPREDADDALLERTSHTTYCPYKGDCSYFSIPVGGDHVLNAVWSYESPYVAVAAIAGHLAFYPDRVDAIEKVAD